MNELGKIVKNMRSYKVLTIFMNALRINIFGKGNKPFSYEITEFGKIISKHQTSNKPKILINDEDIILEYEGRTLSFPLDAEYKVHK